MSIPLPHLLNLALHIGAGLAAIGLGLALLAKAKGTPAHRRQGRVFVLLALVVCATGAAGNVFFRFMSLFAVLTVLVTYQVLSGWHVVHTRADGPNWIDALPSVLGMAVIAVCIWRDRHARPRPAVKPPGSDWRRSTR